MCKLSPAVAALVFFTLSSTASAGVTITGVIDNTGVTAAGFDRYLVTATSDVVGELIGGFDITFTTASMRQVNPLGNPSIFQDGNGFFAFVGEVAQNDSQFLFTTSQLTIPAGTNGESSTQLWAAFVFPAGSPHPAQSITFAQIVVPTGTTHFLYNGQVSIANAGGKYYEIAGEPLDPPPPPDEPEPTSLALLGLGGLMCLRRCRA